MPLLSNRARIEIRRARGPFVLFVVLVVAAVAVVVGLVGQQTFKRPWAGYDDVRVAFDDVKGVVPGQQEVRIAGVKVGVIDKSELVGDRPVLTLSIEPRYAPIYRDATFRLRPRTPLQDMYVEMTRGTRRAGELPAGEIVSDRSTVTPVDVSDVLQTFDGDLRVRLRKLLAELGRGLEDGGSGLRKAFVEAGPFLENARAVAEAFSEREDKTRRLVTQTGVLTAELARSGDTLTSLVKNGNQALGALGSRDASLRASIAELPSTVERVRTSLRTLGATQQELDPALRDVLPALRALGGGLDATDRVSADLRPAVRALRPAVTALRPLVRQVPPTADALAGLSTTLRPQVDDLNTALTPLEACEQSVTRFFAWTLSTLKLSDAYATIPRGEVSVGFDSVPNQTLGTTIRQLPTCGDKVK